MCKYKTVSIYRMARNELEVVVLVPKNYLCIFERFIQYTQLTLATTEIKQFLKAIIGAHQAQLRGHVTIIFRDELTNAVPLFSGTRFSTVPKAALERMKPDNRQDFKRFQDQKLQMEAEKQYNRNRHLAVPIPRPQFPIPQFTRRQKNPRKLAARNFNYKRDSSSEERDLNTHTQVQPRHPLMSSVLNKIAPPSYYNQPPPPATTIHYRPCPLFPIRRNTPPASPDPVKSDLEDGEIWESDEVFEETKPPSTNPLNNYVVKKEPHQDEPNNDNL